jgi:hypothetical protein
VEQTLFHENFTAKTHGVIVNFNFCLIVVNGIPYGFFFENICYSMIKTEKKVLFEQVIAKNSPRLTKCRLYASQNIHFYF